MNIAHIDTALRNALNHQDNDFQCLWDAMNYSALAPGKRIRPYITLTVAEMLGGTEQNAMPFALAVECLHVSSLIHDDLPCMDNDTMRRGQPTCHIQFDEETALLAGDALMVYAFELASKAPLSPDIVVLAIKWLTQYAGVRGMMGGQMIDLQSERRQTAISLDTLYRLQSLKTGCLLKLAARLGGLAAGKRSDDAVYVAMDNYTQALGLLFQITDDILDVTGDQEELGKSTGKDCRDGKSTFVSALGLDGARTEAQRQAGLAVAAIVDYDKNNVLTELARSLIKRKK